MRIELPNSWDGITISMLQELYPILITKGDLIERAYSRVSVLSGVPLDVVRGIKFSDIKAMSSKLSFLDELNGLEHKSKYFYIDGHRYHWDGDFNNMIADQYTSFMKVLKDCNRDDNLIIQNLHRFLACVVIKDVKKGKKWKDGEFNGDNFNEHLKLCKYELPTSVGFPIAVFFYNYFRKLILNMKSYGSQKLTEAEEIIATVQKDLRRFGGGMSH